VGYAPYTVARHPSMGYFSYAGIHPLWGLCSQVVSVLTSRLGSWAGGVWGSPFMGDWFCRLGSLVGVGSISLAWVIHASAACRLLEWLLLCGYRVSSHMVIHPQGESDAEYLFFPLYVGLVPILLLLLFSLVRSFMDSYFPSVRMRGCVYGVGSLCIGVEA
jgi:hypothetical protein